MNSSLRKSGIEVIGDIPWGTHICQFYQTKEDLIDILIPYFKAGLENNELCIWVTAEPLEEKEAIETLRKDVPNINMYLEKGQIEVISYKDWFLTKGVFIPERVSYSCSEKLSYVSSKGYEGVRFSGNISWLEKENWDSFITFKEQMDNIISNCQMILLCTYSINWHNIDEILFLGVNHQFALVKSAGKWKLIESSKRKIAEETAIKATRDWEHTFDAVPDLIAIIDTNYNIVRANRAMAARLGVPPEECVGLTCYRVIHGTTVPPSFCPHRNLLKDGSEHTAEVCEDCLGGYFIVSVSPLYDSKGKVTGSIHVARDINERKQMEEALHESEIHFRTLAVNSPDIITRFDRQYRHTYANPAVEVSYDIPLNKIIGKTQGDLGRDAKNVKSWEEHLESTFVTGRTRTIEYYTDVQGKKYYFNTKIVPEYIADKVVSVLTISRDITDIKETEAKLKVTLENLENLVTERTKELQKAYD